jgi:hypothetical protein
MTDQQKHTPGPWRYQRLNDGTFAIDHVTGRSSDYVANVYCHSRQHDGSPAFDALLPAYEANARLIAAAPDLLAALRNITECAEAGADGANMDLWIEQARAAIAKASA